MKHKHPVSMICAYVLLSALVAFGLAGVAVHYVDLLPEEWRWVQNSARSIAVIALAAAFVAAAIASMRSAWHAERAHQAGPAHRHIMWLAIAYTAVCVVIEVVIGKLGAGIIGAEVPTLALFALLTFFAVAPRLVAYILSGLDSIDKAEAKAEDDDAHRKQIERIEAREKAANAEREASNVTDLPKRSKAGAFTAMGFGALAMASAGLDAVPVQEQFPTEDVQMATQAGVRIDPEAANGAMARGVRASNRALFANAAAIVETEPQINAHQLARRVGIDPKTAKHWLSVMHAVAERSDNALLLEHFA